MSEPIDFYFDFTSPYSYIASEWVDAIAARHGRAVRWHAILLGATFQAATLKSPISFPIKREYMFRDFERSAAFEGLPYTSPTVFPVATQNAARVFWWLHDTQGPKASTEWAHAGLRAYFTGGVSVQDPAVLRTLAEECGQDPGQAEAAWNDPFWKERLKRANDDAIAAGVFGAPFFLVEGEAFWGNDRKAQLERWLARGPY